MILRDVKECDLAQIAAIYNYEVENGVATFDINPKPIEEWDIWFKEHSEGNHSAIVCEVDGTVAGYASLSGYRTKEAYKSTVELSVYVSKDYRRRGIAKLMMKEILDRARADDSIHLVVSVITSTNQVSKKMHESFGFTHSGTIHEAAFKMGQYLGIDNYELIV